MAQEQSVPEKTAKGYLGDGVYVTVRRGTLVLTTENGLRVTNRIVLEPEVYAALLGYVVRVTQS